MLWESHNRKKKLEKRLSKLTNFLSFTPIFLKNRMKQVHRRTKRMSFSNFWYFLNFGFFRAVFAIANFQENGRRRPQRSQKIRNENQNPEKSFLFLKFYKILINFCPYAIKTRIFTSFRIRLWATTEDHPAKNMKCASILKSLQLKNVTKLYSGTVKCGKYV